LRPLQFRALFGTRAELRRFKDGAIVEAAVWDDVADRRAIPQTVCAHLADTHAPFSRQNPHAPAVVGQALEDLDAAGDAAARRALASFAKLDLRLRALTSLPLKVAGVLPASAALRYMGWREAEPVEVKVRFERSARWPAEPAARRHAQTALAIEIARELEAAAGGVEPAEYSCSVFAGGLDVRAGPMLFRLALEDAQPATELHALLHGLATRAEASASLGLVARLAKRWARGHLLSPGQLSDEAVECVAASLFTDSYPLDPPRGALSGLLRFFARLAHFDWHNQVLVVGVGLGVNDAKAQVGGLPWLALREAGLTRPPGGVPGPEGARQGGAHVHRDGRRREARMDVPMDERGHAQQGRAGAHPRLGQGLAAPARGAVQGPVGGRPRALAGRVRVERQGRQV
jgi:U3 small nucleolar RNA-associated protein 22